MSSSPSSGTGFTRLHDPKARRTRDPLGKAALFSDVPATAESTFAPPEPEGRGATQLFSRSATRPGTLVVDCSGCNRRTRISYAEFARLHVPVWLWMPSPMRTHRHWLRCPACRHWSWLRAGWLE
jgi:hypothetical protein